MANRKTISLDDLLDRIAIFPGVSNIEFCAFYISQENIYEKASGKLSRPKQRKLKKVLDDIFRKYIQFVTDAKDVAPKGTGWCYWAHTLRKKPRKAIEICGERFALDSMNINLLYHNNSVSVYLDIPTKTALVLHSNNKKPNNSFLDYMQQTGWS